MLPYGLVQIAGIHDAEEAAMLIEERVTWIGIPLRLPVHREDIPEEHALRIIRSLQKDVSFVLITYLHTAQAVLALCNKLGFRIVQLHGDISASEVEHIKARDAELICIKSLVVRSGNLPTLQQLASQFAPVVDAFITDTFDPTTGACGATGKTHDWSVSSTLVKMASKPVILAGGLTPQNVAEGIATVRPVGVDAHTGVEGADGRKDRAKVRAFVRAARQAFDHIGKCGSSPCEQTH
jgi:phosphoribosylanthranilate isomerase